MAKRNGLLWNDYPRRDILIPITLAGLAFGVIKCFNIPVPIINGPGADIRVAKDSFPIYNLVLSPDVQSRLEKSSLSSQFKDIPDQATRLDFTKGRHNFALTTLDKALKLTKGGTIIGLLDVTTGGDCIYTSTALGGSFVEVKKLGDPRVAYTDNSPSEYLWDLTTVLSRITDGKDNNIAVDDSSTALEKLRNGEVDIAVMWQPQCSNASQFNTLFSTQQARGSVVDAIVVSTKFLEKDPETVQAFLNAHYTSIFEKFRANDKGSINSVIGGNFDEFRVKVFNPVTVNDWIVGGNDSNLNKVIRSTESVVGSSSVEFDTSFMQKAIATHISQYNTGSLSDIQKAQLRNLRAAPLAQQLRVNYSMFRKVKTIPVGNLTTLSSQLRSNYPLGEYMFRLVVNHPESKTQGERSNFNVVTLHDYGVINPIDFKVGNDGQSTVLEVWQDVGNQ